MNINVFSSDRITKRYGGTDASRPDRRPDWPFYYIIQPANDCGQPLQQLYNIADTLIVGRTIGAAALSAVGSAYALMVLLTSVLLGLCMGSGVVFAQLYGRKEHDRMKTSIVNAFVFIMLVSAVITAAAFLLLDHLIVWLHIP